MRSSLSAATVGDQILSRSLAAKSAGIPSILITNFTFDVVYSYLATLLLDMPTQPPISTTTNSLPPDIPTPADVLAPLVSQLHEGYQHADLLLRLPGHIPIPSFLSHPPLPSSQWVDPILNRFYPSVQAYLLSPLNSDSPLLPPRPFPNNLIIPRSVRPAPLLVRPPSLDIYTPYGRAQFLTKTGLPNFDGMKILVVSFGGQAFKRPGTSRTNSRIQSRFPSQEALALTTASELAADNKKPSSKRISRDCSASQTTSPSLNEWPLKPKDMNVQIPLDLEAVDRDLRAHIKSKSLDPARCCSHTIRIGPPSHSDENVSDQTSNDADSGSSNIQVESEIPGLTWLSDNTTTEDERATKRRHTLPRRRHYSHDMDVRRWLATSSRLLIPGAPPANKPAQTILRSPGRSSGVGEVPEMCVIPPTPKPNEVSNTTSDGVDTSIVFTSSTSSPTSTASSHTSTHSSDRPGTEIRKEDGVGLLPDENWIAVICGVSKEQWNAENEDDGLPEGFYVAPRDIYMPDLVAVGDVVLGKLVSHHLFSILGSSELFFQGYGMTSECVDACTPFVYGMSLFLFLYLRLFFIERLFVVSRPLFIEEHGLRMYLDQEGVGVELSRVGYEGGEWARSVEEAYYKGRDRKEAKRRKEYEFCRVLKQLDQEGVGSDDDRRLSERERQGRDMARGVVEWVEKMRMLMK